MTLITSQMVLDTFTEIVADVGEDYMYAYNNGEGSNCVYADPETGRGSCAVGKIFEKLDPPTFEILKEFEKEAQGSSFPFFAIRGTVGDDLELELTHEAFELLIGLQKDQDGRVDYGTILFKLQRAVAENQPYRNF